MARRSKHKPYLRTKSSYHQRSMACGICGRSGFHGDDGLKNHRRFNKTCSDIMGQIRAARRCIKTPNSLNDAAECNVGSSLRQDKLTSLMESKHDDKKDNRHHLWIVMQLALTSFYMYYIYA